VKLKAVIVPVKVHYKSKAPSAVNLFQGGLVSTKFNGIKVLTFDPVGRGAYLTLNSWSGKDYEYHKGISPRNGR